MTRDQAPLPTYLLALTGILSLLFAEGTEPALLVMAAVCLVVWSIVERRTTARLPRPLARATDLLVATCIVGLAVMYFALDRASLSTLAHVLVVAQLARMFRRKKPSDLAIVNGTAFAQIALGAFLAVSPAFVPIIGCAVVFGVWSCLRTLERVRPPAGDARLFVGRPRGRAGLRSRAGALLVPTMLVFSLAAVGSALFVILPRGYPFREHEEAASRPRVYDPGEDDAEGGESESRVTGFSESVKLGDLGRIKMVPWQAFLVQFQRLGRPTRIPDWLMYFRGVSLDTFDGLSWSRSPELRAVERWRSLPNGFGTMAVRHGVPASEAGFRRVHQEFWMKRTTSRVLFALDGPVSFDLTAALPRVRSLGDHCFRATAPHDEGFSYRVSSVVPSDPERRILREDLPAAERERFLRVPQVCEEIAATGKEVAGRGEAHLKAVRLRDWLKERCSYTLSFTDDPRGRPLDDFLYRTRAGHCEYFASALAVLLRGAGIPSRMIVGYRGGQWFEDDELYLVRQSNAHAWVEAWIEGRGWIRLDATPPDEQAVRGETVHVPGVAPPVPEGMKPGEMLAAVRDFGPKDREAALGLVSNAIGFVIREGFGPGRPDRSFPPPLLVLVGAGLLLGVGSRLLRMRIGGRRSRRSTGRSGRELRREPPEFYRAALKNLSSRGIVRRPAQSPREFMGGALSRLEEQGAVLRELTRAFEAVRYGGSRLAGGEEERLLDLAESLRRKPGESES